MSKAALDWASCPLDASYLVDSGLLFEINRLFLHPFGIGLTVKQNEQGKGVIGLKDSRPEPGDLVFGKEALEENRRKFVRFLRAYGSKQMSRRERKLGVTCQHVEPSWE